MQALSQNVKNQIAKQKYPFLRHPHVQHDELLAFIGLQYARGVLGLNHTQYSDLFSEMKGHHIFSATTSRDRFKFIMAHLKFESRAVAIANFDSDRMAAVRQVFEILNSNFSKYVTPSEYLTIAQTLYPLHTQIAFKAYNPNKSFKYGINIKGLNETKYPYTYKALPYAGQPNSFEKDHPEKTPYYICSTNDYIKSLVTETE